jgi:endonuclease/exonuclease/phosphatase (EEP) superfamily protein YafD
MDSQLVLIFLEATIFFGVLGWAVDTWLRSKIVFLYPAFGLVAFGAIAVPAKTSL